VSGAALAQAGAPAADASAQAQASVSAAEVEQFAKAAMAVAEIRSDATITDADKPARLAAAVESSGLQPARFNEIAAASREDEALMKQIQDAAAKAAQADAAPAAPAATAE